MSGIPLRNLTKTSPLREGDDVATWLRSHLPWWTCVVVVPADPAESPGYVATSPTEDVDGVHVAAGDPVELVERVRALERLIAMAAGTHGNVPVGRPIAGCWVDAEQQPGAPAPQAALPAAEPPARRPDPPPVRWRDPGAADAPPPAADPTEAPAPPVAAAGSTPGAVPSPFGLGPPTVEGLPSVVEVAKAQGFTGNTCGTCGSPRMVRTGSCETCQDCYATSSCG